jgi:hypothetical protein
MARRIVLVLTVGAVMALMVALGGVALASHEQSGECTFARGETTCVLVTTETVATTQPCTVGNSGRMGTQAGTVTTTTTTTTVFAGRSEQVKSQTTDTQTGDFVATGNCRNVPGPQR